MEDVIDDSPAEMLDLPVRGEHLPDILNDEEITAIVNLNHASGMVNTEIEGRFKNLLTGEVLPIDKYLDMQEEPLVLLRINE